VVSPAVLEQQLGSLQSAIGGRVRIAYTDGDGEPSIRVIEPMRIYPARNGCTYIKAYCHLREEERTFRLDRIRSWEQIGPEQMERERIGAAGGDSTASTSVPRSVRHGHPFRTLILLALLFLAGRWMVRSGTAEEILWAVEQALSGGAAPPGGYESHESYADGQASGKARAASRTVPANPEGKRAAPQALPKLVKRFSYRGVDIIATPRGNTYLYAAPAHSLSAAGRRALHLKINAHLFRRATGIADPAVERLYAGADTDRDGYLCWKEIEEFQGKLASRYQYRHNTTALRPDEFVARGGGDCEDWALVTCGLLRYWGWDGYVAALFPPGGGDGHALCMARRAEPPRGFEYYRVEEGVYARDGEPVRPGYYVPIDYQVVGGSSSAVKRGWRLEAFYTPERIYGAPM